MPKTNVAVLGAGPIGMSLLHVLKAFAIEDITVTDIAVERQALASACGADHVSAKASGVYDVVIDTVGAVETRRDAVECVRAGGTAVLVGLHSPDLSVAGGMVVAGEKQFVDPLPTRPMNSTRRSISLQRSIRDGCRAFRSIEVPRCLRACSPGAPIRHQSRFTLK